MGLDKTRTSKRHGVYEMNKNVIKKEDFCKSISMDVMRFEELTKKLDILIDCESDKPWSEMILECAKLCNTTNEAIVVGMCLGRVMQMNLCDVCEGKAEFDPTYN